MSDRDQRAPRPTWLPIVAGALVCVSGWVVYRGALAYFFAQDDWIGLARARGLLPPLAGLWRIIPGRLYFELMAPLAGLDAFPYRLAGLTAHLATAVLLFAVLRRRLSIPAAWVGATFFAVHPALFTALYSVSGIGEILSAGFALAALLLAARADRARWLALPLFAASLLSKESTLLLPLAALLLRAHPDAAPAARRGDPLVAALAAVAAAYALYFALAVHGTQFMGADAAGAAERAPYVMAFDATLPWNLLTYVGWTVNFLLPTVRGVADVIERSVTPAAAIGLAAWTAGLLWRPLRTRGWLAGGLIYLCFLLPVLPLPNHTYHYYLYAPLAGAALCVGALADTLLAWRAAERGRAPASPWWTIPAAAVAVVALTVNGAMLVRKIETFPFSHPALRADPTVDRARIARQVHDDLSAVTLPQGVRLLFWSPPSIALERAAGRDTTVESYWERNVREALVDGLAVRTMHPQAGGVSFVRAFHLTGPDTLWAVYTVDGRLLVADGAAVDSLMRRAARR